MNLRTELRLLNVEEHLYIEPHALEATDRKVYMLRLEAVMQVYQGQTSKEVYLSTGIPPSDQSRMIKRFLSLDANGILFGDRALLPQFRIKPYERTKEFADTHTQQQGGLSGVLTKTLENYPEVKIKYEKFVTEFHRKFKGVRFDRRFMAAKFRSLLAEAGAPSTSWPFNKAGLGLRSIEKYTNEIICSEFSVAAKSLGLEGATHATLGTGVEGLVLASMPYDIIQLDAYKIDKMCVIETEPVPGVSVSRVVSRFWLLGIIDTTSQGVLNSQFVFSSEVSARDIERLITDAFLGNWEPKSYLCYPPGSGMLAYVVPEAKYAIFTSVYFDNAMAHHAEKIKTKLAKLLGFSSNYGQLGRPERRSIMENTFKQIAHQFMHRIPSTTGSNPRNGRAENPEQSAEKYNVSVKGAEDALDVWLANYNITPKQGGTFSLSPAEYLRALIENKKQRFILPKASSNVVEQAKLLHDVEYCIVRGSAEGGIAPHITLDKARYTSPFLANSLGLIGTKLMIKVNPKDMRTVEAFLPSGEGIGTLTVLGYWRNTPHSRATRKAINQAFYARTFEVVRKDDIVLSYFNSLVDKSGKKDRLELYRLMDELDCSRAPQTEPLWEGVSDNLGAKAELPTIQELKEIDSHKQLTGTNINDYSHTPIEDFNLNFLDLATLDPSVQQRGGGIIDEDE
ncbi:MULTISPECIES: hypothetical protein [unclassified Pseudomonas]|uniref:hypothetical protein n=1 Tax=unclassified Pseudomonas TaxID=196821 RepID=UPI000D374EAA|nr:MULTISPECIES: hypothetical protein [unclassified Pseudomonas]RAU48001.1 hypothetical protein DBP26_005545 [Pseudomonas sp. RIT 409]RAU55305.1 hypothetical protein DBY65_005120 [Pseudomonas sp. RIT 412]